MAIHLEKESTTARPQQEQSAGNPISPAFDELPVAVFEELLADEGLDVLLLALLLGFLAAAFTASAADVALGLFGAALLGSALAYRQQRTLQQYGQH